MPMGINVNLAAQSALQNLNQTQSDLAVTQRRISTGQKVANASDNGATFAIAQNQRGTSRAYNTVMESLNRVQSTVDVASAAAGVVSDLLLQMKEKALAAVDASTDATSRSILNTDYKALRDQITKAVNNASFNGVNMISGTANATISALASDTGTSKLTVVGKSMTLGSANVTVAANSSFNSAATASTALAAVNVSIGKVSDALASFGTGSRIVTQHRDFISKLQDAVDAGISNITDADLSKESAKLQSLQTKQQLGFQALSIANSSTQSLLSLFR
ncbi:MAG: flagellin [Alphaproteobacteria bacterium PA2]|nr:MAG: flagellin [Alphaproteobacteria bacterium PA2]